MSEQQPQTTESQGTYLLFTPANLALDVATALINQVKTLIDENAVSLTLLLSCPGGNVYAGLLVYNFLKGCPVHLTTHNIGICDSITAVIYAAGARRFSVPHGRFLMHGVSANFSAGSSLSETQLEERLATLRNDTDNIAGVLAGATGKQEANIHEDMRHGLTLDPQQAIDYGLVHEIVEDLYPAGARVVRVA
jgi:ATP-dependent Clp protease protease subunit